MTYLVSFSPWIAYAILSSAANWRVGVIVAAVLQAVLALSLIRRRQLDVLSVGTLTFFAAMSAIALIAPHSTIHRWIPALSAGALAVIAITSLLVGRPFTLAIARRTAPRAVWGHPEFLRLNRFLTSVWGASFACSAVASALLIGLADSGSGPVIAVNVAGFVVPLYITHKTVGRAQARAEAAGLV